MEIELNKKKKGFLCLALCLILTASSATYGLRVNATSMSSITSDSIREKQDQISQAQKERETMHIEEIMCFGENIIKMSKKANLLYADRKSLRNINL